MFAVFKKFKKLSSCFLNLFVDINSTTYRLSYNLANLCTEIAAFHTEVYLISCMD